MQKNHKKRKCRETESHTGSDQMQKLNNLCFCASAVYMLKNSLSATVILMLYVLLVSMMQVKGLEAHLFVNRKRDI